MLEKIMLNIYIAIDFSVNTLFWLCVIIWLVQGFLVWGFEEVVLGEALGVQWYDLLLTLLVAMSFFLVLVHMGRVKEKIGYAIEIQRISVKVKR